MLLFVAGADGYKRSAKDDGVLHGRYRPGHVTAAHLR
jgi:hypothetical protein